MFSAYKFNAFLDLRGYPPNHLPKFAEILKNWYANCPCKDVPFPSTRKRGVYKIDCQAKQEQDKVLKWAYIGRFNNKRFSMYPSPANKEITSGIGGHDSGRSRGTWVTIKGTNSGEMRNENAEAFENILKQYGEIVQPVSTTYYKDVNVPNGNGSCCVVLNRELPDSIDYEAQSGEAYKLYLNRKGKKLYCRYCGDKHELFKCDTKEHDKAKLEKDREEK